MLRTFTGSMHSALSHIAQLVGTIAPPRDVTLMHEFSGSMKSILDFTVL